MSWLSHQKGRGDLLPKLPGFPQDVPSYKRETPWTRDAGPDCYRVHCGQEAAPGNNKRPSDLQHGDLEGKPGGHVWDPDMIESK